MLDSPPLAVLVLSYLNTVEGGDHTLGTVGADMKENHPARAPIDATAQMLKTQGGAHTHRQSPVVSPSPSLPPSNCNSQLLLLSSLPDSPKTGAVPHSTDRLNRVYTVI
jgi:hypothetical protein